ncbi:hypothetical protein [Amycolatopsis taiwanensis]|uniref:hypothetical protein n=1 Tax=Amycolatopsis taiwanensis TaxID=342230 RepID=UPI000487C123|nr:hypothetical protein [Amycolatopsis taiwanensis]
MDQPDYWLRLEYRMCRELARFEDDRLRHLWCDGIVPEAFDLRGEQPRIRGRAWIGDGEGKQEQWDFTLLLDRAAASCEDLDWSALLPDEDLTGWLTPDLETKTLTIALGSASQG